mmetsp:Transcript_6866/g.11692  ORF Transcript_6866/g.11692 Transcript_6866/m.11692 type:complete len:226 (+) Transcript_6866:485-1162(+)
MSTPAASQYLHNVMPVAEHAGHGLAVAGMVPVSAPFDCTSARISLSCNQPAAQMLRSRTVSLLTQSRAAGSHEACMSRNWSFSTFRCWMTLKCRHPSTRSREVNFALMGWVGTGLRRLKAPLPNHPLPSQGVQGSRPWPWHTGQRPRPAKYSCLRGMTEEEAVREGVSSCWLSTAFAANAAFCRSTVVAAGSIPVRRLCKLIRGLPWTTSMQGSWADVPLLCCGR